MPLERLYRVWELAQHSSLKSDCIRKLFIDEPGVIVIQKRRKNVRLYRTLLIPESVRDRVFRRLTNGGAR